MRISNFKYIITDIGGGWGYTHQLYAVTPDGKVYTTDKFDKDKLSLDTELDYVLLGTIDKVELGLPEKINYAVMDASDITDKYNEQYNKFVGKNKDNVVVGELKTPEEIKKAMTMLSSGHPVCTTFHSSNNKELIDKLREELINEQEASN